MKLLAIIILSGLLYSCAVRKSPETTTITDNHVRCTVVKITKNGKGYKHLFLSDYNDTLIRTYQKRLSVGGCYFLIKN